MLKMSKETYFLGPVHPASERSLLLKYINFPCNILQNCRPRPEVGPLVKIEVQSINSRYGFVIYLCFVKCRVIGMDTENLMGRCKVPNRRVYITMSQESSSISSNLVTC
jgi:hypothetical protein